LINTDTFYTVTIVVPSYNRGKKKILLVEDSSEIRKVLGLRLEQSGYDTVEATSGHAALEQARASTPNLIIMDLAMPHNTEDDAIVLLKADPLTRHIPVIVLTAFLNGPLVDRAIAAGAAEILHKPVHFEWLHLVLQRHLSEEQEVHQIIH
jgi:CheY-like chemotaxis protein